jgi:hypothetical protein
MAWKPKRQSSTPEQQVRRVLLRMGDEWERLAKVTASQLANEDVTRGLRLAAPEDRQVVARQLQGLIDVLSQFSVVLGTEQEG